MWLGSVCVTMVFLVSSYLGLGAGVLLQPSPAKTGNKMNTNKMAPLRDIDTRVSPMGKPAYGGLWEHSSLAGSGVGCFFH